MEEKTKVHPLIEKVVRYLDRHRALQKQTRDIPFIDK